MVNENDRNTGKIKKCGRAKKILLFLLIHVVPILTSVVMLLFACVSNKRAKGADARAERAYVRAEKLFIAQNMPQVVVNPIEIVPTTDTHATLTLSYGNYTGFDANNVTIDVRFGPESNAWIVEYLKIVHGEFYYSGKLIAGDKKVIGFRGSLPLKKRFDSLKKKGIESYPIFVRAKWENTLKRPFDVIYKYGLHCTEVDSKRSYYFIPEGIVNIN